MGKWKTKLKIILCSALCVLISGCGYAEPVVQHGRLFDNAGVYAMPRNGWHTMWLEVQGSKTQSFARATGLTRNIAGEKPVFSTYIRKDSQVAATDESVPAEVQIKGNNIYRNHYRSFKISLQNEQLWQGQRIFTLYKCPQDPTKIAMRFGLDTYAIFDDIVSVSAGFVHLNIRDLTSGETEYADYGLYTQTEHLGGRYLRAHGLDRYGMLYEAKDFGFEYEAWMALDEASRHSALEQNNGEGYEKLEGVLRDLAETEDFDLFFNQYFDRDNYLTWLAGAILLGNTRAARDTYQLYSPSDSEKWYFFPAPTDTLLRDSGERRATDPPDSYYGAGMFYGNVLHARFLQNQENRKALEKKVKILRAALNDAVIAEMCNDYKQVLAGFVGQNPDYGMLRYSPQATEERINRIPEQVAGYMPLFMENLHRPAPFSLNLPVYDNGAWVFTWEDMRRENEQLTYNLALTSDSEGTQVLHSAVADEPSLRVELETDGVVYLHLNAENQDGLTQTSNIRTEDAGGNPLWGIAKLVFSGREVAFE